MKTAMEWIRGQAIGHGSFAKVSLAKPTKQNSGLPPLMAVKSCGESHSASLMKERSILEELKDCPEILKCYGDCFTVENNDKLYNVVLEFASGGSLHDRVKNSENLRLPECDVRRYTSSIIKGLQFIHKNGFVHCDIKLENILLFSGDEAKIADFGLAKKAAESKSTCEIRGTPLYLAPETVVNGVQESASDIWALGCLVTEMFTGKPVWAYSDIGALFMKIGVGAEIPNIPGKLSDAGKDFLGKCFVKDPSERWTAEMLLDHPFINGEDQTPSTSPRNPFDFPDWKTEQTPSGSPFWLMESESESCTGGDTAASRLRQLAVDESPDWSVTSGWIRVR